MPYTANDARYSSMPYRRCGHSGLKLPAISLGLWQNFGGDRPVEISREILKTAFDLGVTHFDLANNYGPPPGSAEETFGKIFKQNFLPYRDEMIISTKAGHTMWPGPYGDYGSRKYLLASLDQSLKRMDLDYVDIFYSHRPDPETPLEETLSALVTAVQSGKALYVGISSYSADQTREASRILQTMRVPCLIHQPSYSMLNRQIEDGLLDAVDDCGMGLIAFCPLAQGLLTSKYVSGTVPPGTRAARNEYLGKQLTPELLTKLTRLSDLAAERNLTLAQLALCWILRDARITSALIGASSAKQIIENVAAAGAPPLTTLEIQRIEVVLNETT